MTGAEIARLHRQRHPDRNAASANITKARRRAAMAVARRHPEEYEAEIQKQCQLMGISRYLPPLSPTQDYRVIRHTLEDGQ